MRKASRFYLLTVIFLLMALINGCGGGSGSGDTTGGGGSSLAIKLNFASHGAADANYEVLLSNATGNVNVKVLNAKTCAEVVSGSAPYQQASINFTNQIMSGDTYSVSVSAYLRSMSTEVYDIWLSGYVDNVYVKPPSAGMNEAVVTLQVTDIKKIERVATTLIIEPATPVSKVSNGSQIPAFNVKIMDQFNSVLSTSTDPVTISLENGTLAGVTTVSAAAGIAAFSGVVVSNVSPNSAGYTKIIASTKGLTAYSGLISVDTAASPNTTIAGYLYDPAKTASPILRAVTPAVNRAWKISASGREYSGITDASGFFKADIIISASPTSMLIGAVDASGTFNTTFIDVYPGKLYAGVGKVTNTGGGISIVEAGNFTGVIDAAILKSTIDSKLSQIRSASSGVVSISGTVVENRTSPSATAIAGATVTIQPSNKSVVTDAKGFYQLDGPFPAGSYTISASKTGYSTSTETLDISVEEYGLTRMGTIMDIQKTAPVKQLSSLMISPDSATVIVSTSYALSAVTATVYYTDGTNRTVQPQWTLTLGAGTLSNGIYTAPAVTGSAVLEASYVEDGITVKASLGIIIAPKNKEVIGLVPAPQEIKLNTRQTYDLSQIKVQAYYNDLSSKEVIINSWSLVMQDSTETPLTGNIFTAPDTAGVCYLKMTYIENSITVYGAVKVDVAAARTVRTISYDKLEDTIEISASYDMAQLKATAVYTDDTTAAVTITKWSLSTGEIVLGTMSGSVFTSNGTAGTAWIGGEYTENGTTVSSYFKLNVISLKPAAELSTAEFITETQMKLIFTAPVNVSAFNPLEVKINYSPLETGTTAKLDSADATGKTVILTSLVFFNIQDQLSGVKGGAAKLGLEFYAGNGIKDATGIEIAPSTVGYDIAPDKTAPAAPDKFIQDKSLLLSNANTLLMSLADIAYSEFGTLEIGVATTAAGTPQSVAYETSPAKTHTAGEIIIYGFPKLTPGNVLFYRLTDRVGNQSAWASSGAVPAPPAQADISWHNARLAFKVSNNTIGQTGETVRVYQYDGSSYTYRGKALGPGPYPSGNFVKTDATVEAALTVAYTSMTSLNVESDFINDGIVPAPPAEPAKSLRLRYKMPNYEIMNIATNDVILENDLKALIVDTNNVENTYGRVKKATIAASATPGANGYDPAESLDSNGLKQLTIPGGTLQFTYVKEGSLPTDGNESSVAVPVPGGIVAGQPPVNYMSFNNTERTIKMLGQFGAKNDNINVYQKSAVTGAYTYYGRISPASDGGYTTDSIWSVDAQVSMTAGNKAAFTMLTADGNESVVIDAATVAAPRN